METTGNKFRVLLMIGAGLLCLQVPKTSADDAVTGCPACALISYQPDSICLHEREEPA